jgi:hypothetical protein
MPDNGKNFKHFKKSTLEKAQLQFGFIKLTSLNKLQFVDTVDHQLFIKFYKKGRCQHIKEINFSCVPGRHPKVNYLC